MNDRILTHLACVAVCWAGALGATAAPTAEPVCRVVCDGAAVELHSPEFVFRLDTSDGLARRGVGESADRTHARSRPRG